MTPKPEYAVNVVDEDEVTVDWFFGPGRPRTKAWQLLTSLLLWFFAILPIVITASAVANRDDDERGWWSYREGIVMWELTMSVLGLLLALFIAGFLVLYLVDQRLKHRRRERRTYDEERLSFRLSIADQLYGAKYGPEADRRRRRTILIEPYGDLETYELRDRYRDYGVGVE